MKRTISPRSIGDIEKEFLHLSRACYGQGMVWTCPCSNQSNHESFLGIDANNKLNEPLADDPDAAFVCLACGRVSLEATGEIVRTVDLAALSPEIEKVLSAAPHTA